jgi:hypothetical protein
MLAPRADDVAEGRQAAQEAIEAARLESPDLRFEPHLGLGLKEIAHPFQKLGERFVQVAGNVGLAARIGAIPSRKWRLR